MMKFISHSEEETLLIGERLGDIFPANVVVTFFGDLGAGKTTLIKGLAAKAVGCSRDEVNSPTFVYLNIYEGAKSVYHFDLYRLKGSDEFLTMGFDEYFDAGGICCIEWSERIVDLLPKDVIKVTISHSGESSRIIEVEGIEFDGENSF